MRISLDRYFTMGFGWMRGRGRKDNKERRRSRKEEAEGRKIRGAHLIAIGFAGLPRSLHCAARRANKPARREKSGRSGRDDGKRQIQEGGVKPPLHRRLLPGGFF